MLTGAVALVLPLLAVTSGTAAPSSPTVSYTYDGAGRLASVTDTAGHTANYHYDAEGNVLSIAHTASPPSAGATPQAKPVPPQITSVGPAEIGASGTFTVLGHGFATDRGADLVRVGNLFAPVLEASPGRLVVGAPPNGGGKVTVSAPGGSASGPAVGIRGFHPSHPQLPGVNRNPLTAAGGVTALSGLVERPGGQPLAGVRLTVTASDGRAEGRAQSDASGRFLISSLPSGRLQLVIDGNHVAGTARYGLYAEPVELPAGKTTVLPWVTYLTRLDLTHAITIPSPTTREVTLTSPRLPGVKVRIPRGTVITDHFGHVVRQVSLTPLAVGRTPVPWAPNMVPQYFTMQPGDATATGPGLSVVYPNASNQPPGTDLPYLVDSPDWPGTGWWSYGSGHVTADGRYIVPDRGAVYHEIDPFGFGTRGGCKKKCPKGGGRRGGEPVDLGTGLYIYEQPDLALRDVMGVTLSRSYHQLDNVIRDFGVGMSDSLNLYVVADGSGNFDLFLADGAMITYTPTATTGVYSAVGSPTEFVGSTLTYGGEDPDGPFTIKLKDGTQLDFGNPAYLTKVTDRFGNSITLTRNENVFPEQGGGELQTVTTPDGRWMKFTYGACGPSSNTLHCVTRVQDNSGRTLSYSYDANARLTKVIDPQGGKTSYTWAACSSDIACGELLSVTDPDGHKSITNTYDPISGVVSGQTAGDGGTWSYAYQTNGQGSITQTNWTNPRGVKYSVSFDSSGYPSSETDAVGTSVAERTTTTYDATTHLLDSQTDPLGRTTSYIYDALGNLTGVTLLAGTAKATTYSFTYEPAYNRLTGVTDPLHHTVSISFDDAARTAKLTDALGHSWSVTLNQAGQPTAETDPLGNTTHLSYRNNDLVAVADPLGRVTSTYYDTVGHPLDVTDPQGNVTQSRWTSLDLLASQTDPLGGQTSYTYDPAGNLISIRDALGHTSHFGYDVLSDLTSQTDPLGNTDTFTYDRLGDRTRKTDRNGILTTYGYDPLDRMTSARYGVSGSTAQSTIGYSYDLADRLVKAVDSAAGTYRLTYNGLDDVVAASSPQGTVSYGYNAADWRTSMSVPNQATVAYKYDADNRLAKIVQGTSTTTIGFDADSRRTSLTLPDGIAEKTSYDAASEPIGLSFTHGSTQAGTLGYAYNADGLVSLVKGTLARVNLPAAVSSATYNADNEITARNGTAYSYDKDGNLLSDGARTYSWNARGELASIGGASSATFTYDPFGRRADSTIAGHSTSYLYDGPTLIQDLSGGTPTENLLTDGPAGDTYQLTTPSGTNSSFLTDILGSTVALANSAGAVATSYTYDPNGGVTRGGASSPNTLEFAGSQNDGTGLYSMGARYYSPATGRFISQDPIGFDGGTTNLYDYVGNDPVNFTDPTGLKGGRGGGGGGKGKGRKSSGGKGGRGGPPPPPPPPPPYWFNFNNGPYPFSLNLDTKINDWVQQQFNNVWSQNLGPLLGG